VSSLSKTQVDQLGDRLRKGKIAEGDFPQLDAHRRSFSEAYEEVVATIRETTQLEPTGRPAKSTTSIIEKLRRETIRLSQMQDIAGCRVVVPNMLVQDQVVERLKNALPKAVVVDRRKKPSFGYRAVHIIATARNVPIEIQVRTEFQHLWAQLSEKLSDVLDPAIKYGGGDSDTQNMLSRLSSLIASFEDRELRPLPAELTEKVSQVRRDLRQFLEEAITTWGGSPKSEGGD
jgi:putative GTP pyrophosphokinase